MKQEPTTDQPVTAQDGIPNGTSPAAQLPARRRFLRALSDIVIPPACIGCQTPLVDGNALCPTCWRGIRFIRSPVCDRLGTPLPYDTGEKTVSAAALAHPPDYDRARAVAHHAGLMSRLIAGFKYADRQEARALLARWMTSAGEELIKDADLIVPVPIHPWRLFRRGYNQSAVLAKAIGRLNGKPVSVSLLVRHKLKRPQVGLKGADRRKNPRGAFKVRNARTKPLAGKRVLLIDDVITTGATVNACARELRAAGAKAVDVLAVSLATGEIFDDFANRS